jgi:hypothetical protein
MSDLKDVFKQAAEIAQSVPENMQVAAFNRALDLLTPQTDEKAPPSRPAGQRSRNRRANRRETKGSSISPGPGTKTSKASKKSASGLGPKSAIASLMQSGFFAAGKTRAEVQTHLRTTRGYNIGGDQLGVAMLRLVREGVLERTENKDGQYEFKQRAP